MWFWPRIYTQHTRTHTHTHTHTHTRTHAHTHTHAQSFLFHSQGELKISKTKRIIDQKAGGILRYDEKEFWDGMASGVLRPEPSHANSNTDELKEKLYGLRNSVLLAMLVINVIWMVLLLTIDLTYFESLGIDSSLLPIAFSVLYFGVILIQFAALVVHRVETLAQYVARANIKQ